MSKVIDFLTYREQRKIVPYEGSVTEKLTELDEAMQQFNKELKTYEKHNSGFKSWLSDIYGPWGPGAA